MTQAQSPTDIERATQLARQPAREASSDPALCDPKIWDAVGDPITEAFLHDLRAHKLTRLDIIDAARQLASEGVESARDFLADVEHVPAWVDFEAMRPGAAMGARNVIGFAVGFHSSLPLTYTDGGIADTLVMTGRLTTDGDYTRRLWETATGFIGALDVDQMRPGGTEWERWVRIRVMHTRVRIGLLRSGKWEYPHGAVPISASGTAGGINVTGTYRAHVCRAFGHASHAEVESFTRMWQWIARLLGAPPELIGATPAGQARLDARITGTLLRPNDASRHLTAANLQGIQSTRPFSLLPAGLHHAISHYVLSERWVSSPAIEDILSSPTDPLHEELAAAKAIFERLPEELGLHPTRRAAIAVAALAAAARTLGRIQALPPFARASEAVGLAVVRRGIAAGLAGRDADYAVPEVR